VAGFSQIRVGRQRPEAFLIVGAAHHNCCVQRDQDRVA
jgi:hypothetical protein